MRCPFCGSENDARRIECIDCHQPLAAHDPALSQRFIRCPFCGSKNDTQRTSCIDCHQSLVRAESPERPKPLEAVARNYAPQERVPPREQSPGGIGDAASWISDFGRRLAEIPSSQTLILIAWAQVLLTVLLALSPATRLAAVPAAVFAILFSVLAVVPASGRPRNALFARAALTASVVVGGSLVVLYVSPWSRRPAKSTQNSGTVGDTQQDQEVLQSPSQSPRSVRNARRDPSIDVQQMTHDIMQLKSQPASQELWGRVSSFRSGVKSIPETATRTRLDTLLDEIVIGALDEVAAKHYQRAVERYNRKNILGARTACTEAFNVYQDAEVPLLGKKKFTDSEMWKSAATLWNAIAQITDPRYRFELQGIAVSGDDVRARLLDRNTGQRITVVKGQKLDPFVIKEIDRVRSCVVIENEFAEKCELYQ